MRSKKPTALQTVSPEIEKVRHRLQKWRRKRRHGSRIPEALWLSAVKLAKEHRPAKVANALGLDYYCLKKRLDSAMQRKANEPETRPSFIELAPPTMASHCECIVELEHPRGVKMKIHLKDVGTPDLIMLSQALWSVEA